MAAKTGSNSIAFLLTRKFARLASAPTRSALACLTVLFSEPSIQLQSIFELDCQISLRLFKKRFSVGVENAPKFIAVQPELLIGLI